MILVHYEQNGAKRLVDMQDIFKARTAMLVGGAPSLKEQPVELLEQRGVLTMAINNAALHFRPTMWVSGDNPECYEPRLLLDPTIMKFAPVSYSQANILGTKYWKMPNIYFYMPEPNIPWDEYLSNRRGVPWYNNTLFVAIHTLYRLGIRRIILAGSDFGFSKSGDMYAHGTSLGDLERKWNLDLYNGLVKELRMLKPVFERSGLELMDSSKNSRISQVYKHVSLEDAVKYCLEGFPAVNKDPKDLPHCSKFAPKSIQDSIANWPGYRMVGQADTTNTDLTPVL